VSLPGGAFSAAGAGVKTNLLFFTKGKKTERIWYYDLSPVKMGKKTPLTLAHFGFGKAGDVLPDAQLPATLSVEWSADETNADKPILSYASLLPHRGTPQGDSRYSWTVDFAARRAEARAMMQPLLDQSAATRAKVVDLKERRKRLKTDKAPESEITAVEALRAIRNGRYGEARRRGRAQLRRSAARFNNQAYSHRCFSTTTPACGSCSFSRCSRLTQPCVGPPAPLHLFVVIESAGHRTNARPAGRSSPHGATVCGGYGSLC
jgi:hypothetical protein